MLKANNPVFWRGMMMFVLLVCNFVASQANAGGLSGSVYGGSESMRANSVDVAVVTDVRRVTVQQQSGVIGQYAPVAIGSLLGGLVGNTIGDGATRTAATAVLAAAGGAAGHMTGQYISRQDAVEFILRKQDGRVIAITQPLDNQSQYIGVGDRVRLIQGANLRVVKLSSY
jgi:outer membrane lipoprotein SlyB